MAPNVPKVPDIYVALEEKAQLYYLLKVQLSGDDLYCFIPNFGAHYSRHKSGEAHFTEDRSTRVEVAPPVIVMGEAGTPTRRGLQTEGISSLGTATQVFLGMFLGINQLLEDYPAFNKKDSPNLFTVHKSQLSAGSEFVKISVWAVPRRNPCAFEDELVVGRSLVYKMTEHDPEIWIRVDT